MASSADITAALHLSVTPNCFIKIVLADSAAQVKVGGWGGGRACMFDQVRNSGPCESGFQKDDGGGGQLVILKRVQIWNEMKWLSALTRQQTTRKLDWTLSSSRSKLKETVSH